MVLCFNEYFIRYNTGTDKIIRQHFRLKRKGKNAESNRDDRDQRAGSDDRSS